MPIEEVPLMAVAAEALPAALSTSSAAAIHLHRCQQAVNSAVRSTYLNADASGSRHRLTALLCADRPRNHDNTTRRGLDDKLQAFAGLKHMQRQRRLHAASV